MTAVDLRADVLDVTSTSLVVKSELHAQPVVFHSEGTITFTEGFANEDVDEESILDVHRILRRKNKERSKYRNMKGLSHLTQMLYWITLNPFILFAFNKANPMRVDSLARLRLTRSKECFISLQQAMDTLVLTHPMMVCILYLLNAVQYLTNTRSNF